MRSANSDSDHFDQTFYWYIAALTVMWLGSWLSARYYPGGFDWQYTVASALASQKHNPVGSMWFAGGLSLSMLLLWPYISAVQRALVDSRWSRFSIITLRIGLLSGILLGIERLLIHDLSHWIYKSHEAIALVTFLGLFIGVFSVMLQTIRRQKHNLLSLLVLTGPLLAIGLSQLWLYLQQRHLGWVDVSWREKGIPIWLSFAFWQWLAIGVLWAGLGVLKILVRKR